MSVKVSKVYKSYGADKILDNISFEMERGQIVGLVGLNGAGKSTLMRILAGYLTPDSGEVSVFGKKMSSPNHNLKRVVGYLPEQNPLYPDMYILEYLNFCARLYRDVNRERIDEVVTMMALGSELSKKIKNLSKGYRQRVGIAATVLHRPEFLILDEPTSGLDLHQIVSIRKLIKSISNRLSAVLLSSHMVEEIQTLCNRVIILKNGEIDVDGSPERIDIGRIFETSDYGLDP